jgi:hypothetical protein
MKRLAVLVTVLAALGGACASSAPSTETTTVGDGSIGLPTNAIDPKVEPLADLTAFCTAAAEAYALTTAGALDTAAYAAALAAAADVAPAEVASYYADLAAYSADLATTIDSGAAISDAGIGDLFVRGVATGTFVKDACGFDIGDTGASVD